MTFRSKELGSGQFCGQVFSLYPGLEQRGLEQICTLRADCYLSRNVAGKLLLNSAGVKNYIAETLMTYTIFLKGKTYLKLIAF